ncbi:phospholipase D-like domain-containing protein [Pseudoduganella umbonata]|uniref:Phosphatidylserine/phosphatidylglycerophosphate/ cardiolipin synthase-like enzyme n=1 Tax=Pseudoduganella umbonata TaxID=864828 RepID=A0A4P8HQV1_9BURK|nr:phospholipase D-like domain-containing protein [Pseudoduganella umbonata]MBB3222773.1 phosphatidylserine/phosphatidylglycerophosphate/cardiolipin synthase-like enzyme [Pseudoduganella umbonata]QCP10735.1 phospholipase [Pseudoduganella umbonata]
MTEAINRTETTYVDARTGTGRCTVQWLLENRNLKGKTTHPITHNNKLTMFICGKEGFQDIAKEIRNAKGSIDICCWGFDPGMELERTRNGTWPRGDTYGDLLVAAGRRGVRVRLLVWYDWTAAKAGMARNMPGMTHDTHVWRMDGGSKTNAGTLSAANSIALLRSRHAEAKAGKSDPLRNQRGIFRFTDETIPLLARKEYCFSWYRAARGGMLKNIEVRLHNGDGDSIERQLSTETTQPGILERTCMESFGTHHQKPLLIDFDHADGTKAVGYVMGLNSVTEYWDTTSHQLENPRREEVGPTEAAKASVEERGFKTLKPFRDYACRIDRGGALVPLYNNFICAWNRARSNAPSGGSAVDFNAAAGNGGVPAALLRKPCPDDSTVQIVRTQPAEDDLTIRELYFKAADNASLAFRYLYVENQYFQYEEWTQRLVQKRRDVMKLWNKARAGSNKHLAHMPVLHVFVVIPMPERKEMISRTYDALAHLGEQGAMKGQQAMIGEENRRVAAIKAKPSHPLDGTLGRPQKHHAPLPEVVRHANSIDKPDPKRLERESGIKVCTAMLNACGSDDKQWRYREIYIHSKLLLVDDVFCTLGSANLNQRSMTADSELNLATIDPKLTTDLRWRVWKQLSGGAFDGGDGSKAEIEKAFSQCQALMRTNALQKKIGGKLTGFLLPLADERSSTIRLG